MRFIRPKIIGSLRIQEMLSGDLAVINDIKSLPNKIVIPCKSNEEGKEIIRKIKDGKAGDTLYF